MNVRLLLFSISILLATASVAQESPLVVSAPKQIPQEAQLLNMAGKLVSYGRQTKSAMPLIQAVQIYRQLNVVDDTLNEASSPFSEDQILADATKFADGNKNLLALIKDTEKNTRGAISDPKYGKLGGPFERPLRFFRSIKAGNTIGHHVPITINQYVQVTVDGQGENFRRKNIDGDILASDLRLKVYDGKGRTIAQDLSKGSNCSVSFIASSSSIMLIQIENVGKVSDDYVLFVYRQ